MKYESIIRLLSLQYDIHTIDTSKDLVKQLRNIQKDHYEDNERIVVDMPDISVLNDLQNIVNNLDISNFFVWIVTEDNNIVGEIERVEALGRAGLQRDGTYCGGREQRHAGRAQGQGRGNHRVGVAREGEGVHHRLEVGHL